MPILIPYLFKLFISLGIVFLFYYLVLRRLTFYNANRWYLLTFTCIAFIVPFVNVTSMVHENGDTGTLLNYIPQVQQYSIGLEEATHCPMPLWSTNWTKWDWLSLAIAVGALFLLIRFSVRCISFLRLRSKAKLISDSGMKIYHVDQSIIPFSFGNAIFINSNQHSESELREIIRHEFIHVRQRHTIDILWAELLCILNWYNPAAWMLKSAIRQNLEFIADHKVLENGVDKKQYQYLLLKVIGNDQFSIAQKFNFSSLKKRIAMMNKTKSARVNLLRFLIFLPVIGIILISFREQLTDSFYTAPSVFTDTIPEVKRPNEKGFIINVKDNKGECMVVVKDKTGKVVEKVALLDWNDKIDSYEAKYGEVPPPPAPKRVIDRLSPISPDHPLAPVEAPLPADVLTPAETMEAPLVADVAHPMAPVHPSLAPLPPMIASEKLATLADDFEINNNKITLKLKNGTTEKYDLNKPAEREKFESKWGKLIELNNDLAPSVILDHTAEAIVVPVYPSVSEDAVLALDEKPIQSIRKEEMILTITKYATREQLEEYKKEAKAKGIELSYDQVEYDSKGRLSLLGGTLKYKGSKSNFVVTEFNKLILTLINDSNKVYIKIVSSDSKEVVDSPDTKPKTSAVQNAVTPTKPAVKPVQFNPFASVKKDDC